MMDSVDIYNLLNHNLPTYSSEDCCDPRYGTLEYPESLVGSRKPELFTERTGAETPANGTVLQAGEHPKRKRTRTSAEQLRILQSAFDVDPMPSASVRVMLAKRLGMSSRAVQVWFQNRRAKEKLDQKRALHSQVKPIRSTSVPSLFETGCGYPHVAPMPFVSRPVHSPVGCWGHVCRCRTTSPAIEGGFRYPMTCHDIAKDQTQASGYFQDDSMFDFPARPICPGGVPSDFLATGIKFRSRSHSTPTLHWKEGRMEDAIFDSDDGFPFRPVSSDNLFPRDLR